MKNRFITLSLIAFLCTGISMSSCKNKSETSTDTVNSTTMDTANTMAPVTVSNDEAIRNGLTDATKDYPGVTATVENGVVTLNGTVERDRLPNLMQSIHSLHPEKVTNNLTLK